MNIDSSISSPQLPSNSSIDHEADTRGAGIERFEDNLSISEHAHNHMESIILEQFSDGITHVQTPKKNIDVSEKEPKGGMEFESEEDAYAFYNDYAREAGFSIRKNQVKKSNEVVLFRNICCAKEGFRHKDKRDVNVLHHRPITRTGCKACMQIRLHANGKYKVVKVELTHNHDVVSPGKSHMLRSQRRVTEAQKAQILSADRSRIKSKQAFDLQAIEAGGRENLGYLRMDLKNALRTTRQMEMEKGDAASLLEYFQRMQLENPSFFYALQVDEQAHLTNIFWADARCVVDYINFGDVICFDTTYKINNYGRPFAPFVGVNHHRQSVIFGAALLYDETAASFEWVFECFLKAMSGIKPKTILTDQCAAMARAIKTVFPETHHRLCIWHIYQNAAKNLKNTFASSSTFASEFRSCIYDHVEEEDFFAAWKILLEKHGLEDDSWLNDLFKQKEKWALVYGRNTFCADMVSTQRSEGINSVLKKYLNVQYNLFRFFEHYDQFVVDRRYEEYFADFKTCQTTPMMYANSRMLSQAVQIYTREAYQLFEVQYKRFLDCDAFKHNQVGTKEEYIVKLESKYDHLVTFDSSTSKVACTCKTYEFMGILCCHALKVLDCNHVKLIPPEYIMKRWTRNAKVGNVFNHQGCIVESDPKVALGRRYRSLCHQLINIATIAAGTEESYLFAMDYSHDFLKKVEEMFQNMNFGHASHANIASDSQNMTEGQVLKGTKDGGIPSSTNSSGYHKGIEVTGIRKRETSRRGRRFLNALEKATKMKRSRMSKVQNKSSKDRNEFTMASATPPLGTQHVPTTQPNHAPRLALFPSHSANSSMGMHQQMVPTMSQLLQEAIFSNSIQSSSQGTLILNKDFEKIGMHQNMDAGNNQQLHQHGETLGDKDNSTP